MCYISQGSRDPRRTQLYQVKDQPLVAEKITKITVKDGYAKPKLLLPLQKQNPKYFPCINTGF